jgi:hypothetical protein
MPLVGVPGCRWLAGGTVMLELAGVVRSGDDEGGSADGGVADGTPGNAVPLLGETPEAGLIV